MSERTHTPDAPDHTRPGGQRMSTPDAGDESMETIKTGRALSVQQPWAWLIAHGFKPVENRGWPTRVRGTIGIHAGQKFDREGYEWVRREFPQIDLPAPESFERGGIVGRARLVDCVEEHESPWFFGPFGFVMADAEPLPLMPCRGALGFFRPALRQPAGAS